MDRTGETIIPTTTSHSTRSDIADLASEAGIERVHILAWRDLADVEAGGSEMYCDKLASIWAEAGLEIMVRTSYAQGQTPYGKREGYQVVRKSGRYTFFPSAIVSERLERHGSCDAVLEFWNGVPFLTPLWFRGHKAVVVHHVHRNMWDMVLEPKLARFGRLLEGTLAPPFYQRVPVLTPSYSSRDELIALLGLPARNITVTPPGIDPRFVPNGPKATHPLIVTVGRLMPPKRFDEMIRISAEVRKDVPDLELVVVGDGYERQNLEQLVTDLDAHDWIRLAGRVSDDELLSLYQRAWAVTSASSAEGWGMTLTEAAACGTPAVASRIAGHRDSISEDRSGLLGTNSRDIADKLRAVLTDPVLRNRLSEGALKHAAEFTWESCALTTFNSLARGVPRRYTRPGGN